MPANIKSRMTKVGRRSEQTRCSPGWTIDQLETASLNSRDEICLENVHMFSSTHMKLFCNGVPRWATCCLSCSRKEPSSSSAWRNRNIERFLRFTASGEGLVPSVLISEELNLPSQGAMAQKPDPRTWPMKKHSSTRFGE
jgi:hypothetical protein